MPRYLSSQIFLPLLLLLLTLISAVEAWSPSANPSLFSVNSPSGLKFGDLPTTTQCCFSTSSYLFCLTDGSDRDRVRLQQFDKAPEMVLRKEITVDAFNSYQLSSCSFSVTRTDGTIAAAGFKTTLDTSRLIVVQIDPTGPTPSVTSFFTLNNCLVDTPTKGAFLLDSNILLASAGTSGIARILTSAGAPQGTCQFVSLLANPGTSTTATTYGGFVSTSAKNMSYWVTNQGLFTYNAQINKVLGNLTQINSTLHIQSAENPTNTVSIFTSATVLQPPAPPSSLRLIHKIDISTPAAPSLVSQNQISQELVGFMEVSLNPPPGKLFAGIRSPYLGLAVFDLSNLAQPPSLYDATADSPQDPAAVLPSGSTFFQSGTPPTVFALFDPANATLFMFATPRAATGKASSLNLPTIGLAFDAATLQRKSHFVNRAGATFVASSAVGGGSFFLVLSSTPSNIVMLNAEDLSVVQSEFQSDVLNSTDTGTQLLDSICVFDESNSRFYVASTFASNNLEPASVAKFDVQTGQLDHKETIELSSGKRQGVLVLADNGNSLYVCGETGTTNQIYIQKISVGSATAMTLVQDRNFVGVGSKVISAKLDASENYLLLATDTTALVSIDITGGVIQSALATTIRAGAGAQSIVADRYGFVTVGYANTGSVDIIHPQSGVVFISKQPVGGNNFNVLRSTDDDNYFAISVLSTATQQQGPTAAASPPSTSLFAISIDYVSATSFPLTVGGPNSLSQLSSPIAVSTASGFSFALGRSPTGNQVALYRTGSRTAYEQHRELTSFAKRAQLVMPNANFSMMTYDEAKTLCQNAGTSGLISFFDKTELDALRGLFDQDPVWVGGRYDGSQWVWSSGASVAPSPPAASWWAAGFPFESNTDRCAYVRQGKIFNAHCSLQMLPACSKKFAQVNRALVADSIPAAPWITLQAQSRTGTIGGVYGLRRVDFVSNYFECMSQPWSSDSDWDCGAAWDTAIFGTPADVQMVSETKVFVTTSTSLYEVDLIASSQNLIRQYNSFRRKMQLIQKWNMTVIYGETRTDFIVSYGTGLRLNVLTLSGTANSCDNVQFVDSTYVLCVTRAKIVRYKYTIAAATFRLALSDPTTIAGSQLITQDIPAKFSITGNTPNVGVLKMSIFNELVTQDVAFNATANPVDVCELVERTSPSASISQAAFKTYTSMTVRSGDANTCTSGQYQNCIRTQIPLTRPGLNVNCSSGGASTNPFPRPTKTLGWVDQLLAKVADRNGQVSLTFGAKTQVPSDRPTEVFQVTSSAMEDGLVTLALTVKNFPCLTRGSDLSTYCMSTITSCNPALDDNCYETHAFGSVRFASNCDVIRYCTATILTALNIYEFNKTAATATASNPNAVYTLTEKMIANAQTFAGELDTLLQFNVTGEPTSRITTLENRLAMFQSTANASRIEVDRSTSWLTRDSPPRAFNLMHPTVASSSASATAATMMTDAEVLFWKRSKKTVTGPGKNPLYYAVGVFTDNLDEFDNVVRCRVRTQGIVRFAPDRNPGSTMPPLVVDSRAPSELGVASAVFQNVSGLLSNESTVNVSTGDFAIEVGCNVTTALQLFVTYDDGAVGSIPFYIIGKDVVGAAGAPPATINYPALPGILLGYSNSGNFSSTELSSLSNASSVSEIQSAFDSLRAAAPASFPAPRVTLSVQPEIGSFVVSDTCPASIGSPSIPDKDSTYKNAVTLNLTSAATFTRMLETCVAFYPSPALEYKNQTQPYSVNSSLKLLKVSIISNLVASPGIEEKGVVAVPLLSSLPLRNSGPELMLDPCNVTITVGHQKIASFGQVFKQRLGVDLDITSKIVYRGDSSTAARSQEILVSCNASGFCWTVFESIAATTNFELTATDGYFYTSTMCGVYAEFVTLRVGSIPPMYEVHAGTTFSYTIPSSLFLSSATWTIISVTEGSFNLESGVSFQSPSLIVGKFAYARLYNLTVVASNIYGSAIGYVLINSTNQPPVAAAFVATLNLRALVAFEQEVTLNTLVTDGDGDALEFTILDTGLLPTWLQTSIAPGTMTTSPQILTLQGTATADYANKTYVVNIKVADSWNSTKIQILLAFRAEYIYAVPQTNASSATYYIHPGSAFAIPFNLSQFFVSSTPWDFYFTTAIDSNLNIAGLSFTGPTSAASTVGTISGTLEGKDALEVRNITIKAITPFQEASASVIVIPINSAPNLTATTSSYSFPIVLGTFYASHTMKVETTVSNYFSDADSDPLTFSATVSTRDNWIVSMISFSPEGYTVLPKTMTIEGTVPASAVGRNVTIALACDDKWNATSIPLLIIIPEAKKPVLVKPLPHFTVTPEDSISEVIAVTPEYFTSPDGDQLTVSVQVVKGSSWITTTLQGDVGSERLTINAAPSVVQDDTAEVLVSVKNPFGNVTESKVVISAVMTDWQRVYATAVLVVSLVSAVLGVIGLWAYYPLIISFCKGRRVVIKCPLSAAENPKYRFPDDTEEVKVLIREEKCIFKPLPYISHWLWNFATLKPPPRVGPPCYLKIFDKHLALRLDRDYDVGDAPDDCLIQFFDGQGIIKEEFDVNFREVMCVPTSMTTGIFRPREHIGLAFMGVDTASTTGLDEGHFAIDLPPKRPTNPTNESGVAAAAAGGGATKKGKKISSSKNNSNNKTNDNNENNNSNNMLVVPEQHTQSYHDNNGAADSLEMELLPKSSSTASGSNFQQPPPMYSPTATVESMYQGAPFQQQQTQQNYLNNNDNNNNAVVVGVLPQLSLPNEFDDDL